MPRPVINADECTGCGICVDDCPNSVLDLVNDLAAVARKDKCDGCNTCAEECPMGAVAVDPT